MAAMTFDRDAVKARVNRVIAKYPRDDMGFAPEILSRLRFVDVQLNKTGDGRDEAVTVHEIEVQKDMLNGKGTCHGGCMAWLLDVCTSYCIAALGKEGSFNNGGISTDITIRYLAPGNVGDTLVITSKTLRQGKRYAQATVDFRQKRDDSLVATGIHAKMDIDHRFRQSKL